MSSPWRSMMIPGLYLTTREMLPDSRGSFTKILGEGDDADVEPFVTREVFWSRSTRGVVRGLHVQLPPRSTRKLVFVAHGAVRDFVLDLRAGSPTYGTVAEVVLDERGGGLIIPDGCAHGFEVVSDEAAMIYLQEDFHSLEHDSGILYSSVGIVPEADHPIVSPRDLSLDSFDDFVSPFEFS